MADKAQLLDVKSTPDGAPPAVPAVPPKRSPGHRGADVRDTVAEMAAKAQEISLEAGSKMAAAMKDVISAAAGISGFAIESARDLVQYMVRRGQMTQDEADKLIREAEGSDANRKPHPVPPPSRVYTPPAHGDEHPMGYATRAETDGAGGGCRSRGAGRAQARCAKAAPKAKAKAKPAAKGRRQRPQRRKPAANGNRPVTNRVAIVSRTTVAIRTPAAPGLYTAPNKGYGSAVKTTAITPTDQLGLTADHPWALAGRREDFRC
jgi:polyhydroxyalkanoate synthesis regulator phasin